ncbi:MAG: glycoside hydrolase family 3 protein [Rickettsiaceae bacterium]|nr:MAG: glycoside hydrolase family 3 protein [Rickettsiaceae bacterium]
MNSEDNVYSNMVKPIIFGMSGLALTTEEKVFFQQHKITSFILFKRNIESTEQLIQLTEDLKKLHPYLKVTILIDQEGGRVARIKPPIIDREYPPMSFFSEMFDNEGEEQATLEIYKNFSELTLMLRSFGIDSGCSPVADLYYSYTHQVIGDRSFGLEVDKVVKSCLIATKAIQENGGIAIMKHIPGHGRAKSDSHLTLPRVDASFEELNSTDFAVFRQLSNNYDLKYAMTAHIIFDAIDPELPITFSKKAIDFIRKDIGFKGIIVTDDICMHALHVNDFNSSSLNDVDVDSEEFVSSIGRATKKSLAAGCDIILHCSGKMSEMKKVVQVVEEFLILNNKDNII